MIAKTILSRGASADWEGVHQDCCGGTDNNDLMKSVMVCDQGVLRIHLGKQLSPDRLAADQPSCR